MAEAIERYPIKETNKKIDYFQTTIINYRNRGKVNLQNFDVNEGQVIENGKSKYQDNINIRLDKKSMLQIMRQIAVALECGHEETLLMLAGRLRK